MLKVLFISNFSMMRCGVRMYGDLWVQALRDAGVQVDKWDGTYDRVRAQNYLPLDAAEYDLVHLNWDPQTINHFLPEHFSGVRRLSLFLHDVPPNSTCPVAGIATLKMAMELGEGITVIDHAVPVLEVPAFTPSPVPVIGTCGIRADAGVHEVEELCRRRGWIFNGPSRGWLTTEDEIRRLGMSDVNVCWYHTSGRGKSMGAMFCVAARRPLVLSDSTMFSNLWPYKDEVYFGDPARCAYGLDVAELERQVEEALEEKRVPERARVELSWTRRAEEIKALWERAAG